MGSKTEVPGVEAAPTSAQDHGEILVSEEEVESETPGADRAVLEDEKRQADLNRLNTMSTDIRREIASMDMMGEFGSKVGLVIRPWTLWIDE